MSGNFWKVRGGGLTLRISGTPVTTATQNSAYAGFTCSTLGGNGGNVFSVQSGTLPTGITLNSSTGEVSGTPMGSGTSSGIVIRVTDAFGHTADLASFSIVVAAAAGFLTPSATWDGTPGTGFAPSGSTSLATLSTSTTRTTAKPALRPLTMQHHLVTGADGTDWLIFTCRAGKPIDKVRIWLEGNFVDVTTKRNIDYVDTRLVAQTYRQVYAAQLDHAAAQALAANGHAYAIAEAWTTDGTWQRQNTRVLTIHYRPGSALTAGARYDEVKTVGPTGKDFTTLGAAMGYAAGPTKTNTIVGIRIDASGDYDPQSTVEKLTSTVPMEVFAGSGVTARMGNFTRQITSHQVGSLRFRGPGILIDISTALGASYASPGSCWIFNLGNSPHKTDGILQFEGVEYTCTDGQGLGGAAGSGAGFLRGGFQPGQFWIGNVLTHGDPQIAMKDCYLHDLPSYGLIYADLALNNTVSNVSGSVCESLYGAVHGGTITNCGADCSGFMTGQTNLAITFAGTGTPTVYKSTANANSGNLELRINGVADLTIAITGTMTLSDLNTAINSAGNANWSSTMPNASILSAVYVAYPSYAPSHGIGTGGDSPAPFTAGVCNLTFRPDIHADIVPFQTVAPNNNIVEYVFVDQNIGVAPISFYVNGGLDVVIANLVFRDTSSAIASQSGAMGASGWDHLVLQNITMLGGTQTTEPQWAWALGTSTYTRSYITDCYIPGWSGTAWSSFTIDGLIVRKNTLPTGATTNCSSTSMAAESTYMDTTTAVPTAAGLLLHAGGRYAGAKCTTAQANTVNGGWAPA